MISFFKRKKQSKKQIMNKTKDQMNFDHFEKCVKELYNHYINHTDETINPLQFDEWFDLNEKTIWKYVNN